MSLLDARDLTLDRGNRRVLEQVSLRVDAGECVGLLGPNGAGKTTLLRAMLGLLPATGTSNIKALPAPERARTAGWLPQSREIAWPVPVETLVMLGRLPHLATGAKPGAADRAAVAHALERMGLTALATRPATELSGGEQARALIARVLVQDTPLILADEPVAGLDPSHQIATMGHFRDLAAEGRGLLVSLHDLGLAGKFCTRLVLMSAGRVVADGAPVQVLTPENLARVFGITAHIEHTADGLVVQPLAVLP